MGKESITLSMKLAKIQCYKFECFEDNYSLTISTQGCRINTRKFNTKGTLCSLYRALKHSICQHKLDLNLSKTKQPLLIINSHLNFRYLTASVNL